MMGAVTVASQAYPYRHTIKHGETGLLTPNNEDDWYRQIASVVKDKELRQRLVETARTAIDEKFLLEDNWVKYRDYFQSLVDNQA